MRSFVPNDLHHEFSTVKYSDLASEIRREGGVNISMQQGLIGHKSLTFQPDERLILWGLSPSLPISYTHIHTKWDGKTNDRGLPRFML